MKQSFKATVSLWSNSSSLQKSLERYFKQSLKVVGNNTEQTDYRVYLIDSDKTGAENQDLTNALASIKTFSGKVCLVISSSSVFKLETETRLLVQLEEYLRNNKLDIRLVRTFDLYDSDGGTPVSSFEELVCRAVRDRTLVVSKTGENVYYPTSSSDLYQIIVKSLFTTSTSGEVYTAVGERLTDLEIAYLLKNGLEKQGKVLEIDLVGESFKSETDPAGLSVETQAQLNWIPQQNLEGSLDKLLEKCPTGTTPQSKKLEPIFKSDTGKNRSILEKLKTTIENKIPRPPISEDHRQTPPKRGWSKVYKYILVLVVLVFLPPIIMTVISLKLSSDSTYASYQEIRVGNEKKSRQLLNQAKFWNKIANDSLRVVIPMASVAKYQMANVSDYIIILGHGQTVLESVIDSYNLGNQLYLALVGKQVADQKAILAALRINMVSLSEKLSQIQLLLDRVSLPFGYQKKIEYFKINQQFNQLKKQIADALPLLDLISQIVSDPSLQHYLLVVLDQNELRATGGYLTTYGLLTLDQGKIIDLQVNSSFALDKLIEGQIEPPNIIKTLLVEKNWFFRDSNLDANYVNSAKQIDWFYQRFKKEKPGGVISLNTSLLRFVLSQTGQLVLPDGQVVTSDNLDLRASNPTTSQGLDVITATTQILAGKLLAGELNFSTLARSLLKTVALNEINVWFEKTDLQALTDQAGISGDIKQESCHPQLSQNVCRADTIYLNESNFSVSKLNYYLKRKQNYKVVIDETGEVSYTITLDYFYPVPAPTNLNQDYKAYYQLFLPEGAKDVLLTLDNQDFSKGNVSQVLLSNLIKLEFSGIQAVNQPHRLVIKFVSGNKLDLTRPQVAYTMAYLKQSGTTNDSLAIQIVYPKKLQPKNLTIPMKQISDKELVFETNETRNENIGILFKNTSL